jgi:hypothetical protein
METVAVMRCGRADGATPSLVLIKRLAAEQDTTVQRGGLRLVNARVREPPGLSRIITPDSEAGECRREKEIPPFRLRGTLVLFRIFCFADSRPARPSRAVDPQLRSLVSVDQNGLQED